jgi:metallo-beta-lactamase family protein
VTKEVTAGHDNMRALDRADGDGYRQRMSETPKLRFCGAARGVTGSNYHLEVGDARLVIDCGTFQGAEGEDAGTDADGLNRAPFPYDPKKVVGVVLTHGHLDHVGRLPLLGKAGFSGTVHGHSATLEVAKLIMEDTARMGLFSSKKPLYGDHDVEHLMARQRPMQYGEKVKIGPFTVQLFDAGHILGSSSVRVEFDGKAILFSGDLGIHGAPILRDPNTTWDPEAHAVDWVITESTYGDRSHPQREVARAKFRDAVKRAVSDGGKLLIPAFAVGRTQEVLYDLNVLVESGQLPGIPVIVDGPLGLDVTGLYARHKECYDDEALALLKKGDVPLEFRDLYSAKTGKMSEKIHDIPGAAIIIAGSGMCSGGRIVGHLATYLPDPKTDVIFVGYQARGTLGHELQEGKKSVVIDGETVPVRAAITTISGFSAHADREGLADWLSKVPLKKGGGVFVCHGEEKSSTGYAKYVTDRFQTRTIVPKRNDEVALALA